MVGSIQWENWDLNGDKIVNKDDLEVAATQGKDVPEEVATTLATKTFKITKDEEGEIQVVEDTAAEIKPSIPLPEMPDVSTFTTSAECDTKISEIEAYIKKCNDRISTLDGLITTKENEIKALEEQKAAAQAEYDSESSEVKQLQNDLTTGIKSAVAVAENFSTELSQKTEQAVADAIDEYKNATTDDGKTLSGLIKEKLAGIGVNTSYLDNLMSNNTALGIVINQKCDSLQNLCSKIRGFNIQLNAKNLELANYKGEKAGLESAVSKSETYLTSLKSRRETLKAEEEAAAAASSDPIGFEKDGKNYDFISDNDGDGVFDGASEFLGAQDGWSEMEAYDKNNDGKVAGDELKDLKVLVTDKDGNTSFSTADKIGVDEIDLTSHEKKNEDIGNGNTLIGNYDITVDGQEIEGYQTLDDNNWLQQKYGDAYGDKIAESGQNIFSQSSSEGIKFYSLDPKNKVDTASIKSLTGSEILTGNANATSIKDNAIDKKENYYYEGTSSVENSRADRFNDEKKIIETKEAEKKEVEKKQKKEA